MTTQSKEERRAVLKRAGGVSLFGSAAFALLFSLFLGGAVLLTAALLFSFNPGMTVHVGTVGCAVGAVTALLGGFFAGRRQKHTGALAGLLFGLFYLVFLLFVARFYGDSSVLPKKLVGYTIFLLLSALGGALGTVRTAKRHRAKRRR